MLTSLIRVNIALASVAFLGGMLFGQTITAVTPKVLKQHRDEYLQAMQAWQQTDPNLEKDLHSGDRADLLKRLDEAEARTAKFLESKKTYFGSLRSIYQQQYQKIEATTDSGAAPPETKEAIQERADSVERERHELEDRMRSTPNAEVRAKLAAHAAALRSIEESLSRQKYIVENWGKSTAGLTDSRKQIMSSLKQLMDIFADQEKGADEIRSLISGAYSSMKEVAGKPLPAGYPPLPKAADPKPVPPPKTAVETQVTPSAPAPAAQGLSGEWTFLPKSGERDQPNRVTVTLTDSGDTVSGSFSAFGVPRRIGLPGTASFSFAGPKKGAVWSFGGQTGLLEVIPVDAKRIEIVLKDEQGKSLLDLLCLRN